MQRQLSPDHQCPGGPCVLCILQQVDFITSLGPPTLPHRISVLGRPQMAAAPPAPAPNPVDPQEDDPCLA